MISHKFNEQFMKEIGTASDSINNLCLATIDLWKVVKDKFIPTPAKFT